MRMNKLEKYEYGKSYEVIEKYEKKLRRLMIDIEILVDKLNEAESTVKLIADTYRLPEAEGYFNDTSK